MMEDHAEAESEGSETEADGGEREPGDESDGSSRESGDGESDPVGIAEARRLAVEQAGELLDYPVEGVIKVEASEDGWRVLVEVKERDAVPDTQDILGRYELEVGSSGALTGYGLLERYRRGELRGDL